jgi:hypothetical protein
VLSRERVDTERHPAPLTIGRGLEADVVLDDPFVAPVHATVTLGPDGVPRLSDRQSQNGLLIDGRRMHGAQDLPLPGGLVQIGRTRLRVRSGVQPLPPERPDRQAGMDIRPWHAIAGGAACAAIALYLVWLEIPRDFAPAAAMALVLGGLSSLVWIAVWALLSRVMAGEWRWMTHAAIGFGAAALLFVLRLAADVGSFSFGTAMSPLLDVALGVSCVALALYLHITNASTLRRRTAALCALLVPLAVGGTGYWVKTRSEAMDVNYIAEVPSLYPPALRLRPAGSPEAFFADAAALQAEAEAGRRKVDADDDDLEP